MANLGDSPILSHYEFNDIIRAALLREKCKVRPTGEPENAPGTINVLVSEHHRGDESEIAVGLVSLQWERWETRKRGQGQQGGQKSVRNTRGCLSVSPCPRCPPCFARQTDVIREKGILWLPELA